MQWQSVGNHVTNFRNITQWIRIIFIVSASPPLPLPSQENSDIHNIFLFFFTRKKGWHSCLNLIESPCPCNDIKRQCYKFYKNHKGRYNHVNLFSIIENLSFINSTSMMNISHYMKEKEAPPPKKKGPLFDILSFIKWLMFISAIVCKKKRPLPKKKRPLFDIFSFIKWLMFIINILFMRRH